MGEIRSYRLRENVRAERVTEAGWTNTRNGREFAHYGTYKVYGNNGLRLVRREAFEGEYEPVDTVAEFNPDNYSVLEVVNFLKLNPDEIERVKAFENRGKQRKTILDYTPE